MKTDALILFFICSLRDSFSLNITVELVFLHGRLCPEYMKEEKDEAMTVILTKPSLSMSTLRILLLAAYYRLIFKILSVLELHFL